MSTVTITKKQARVGPWLGSAVCSQSVCLSSSPGRRICSYPHAAKHRRFGKWPKVIQLTRVSAGLEPTSSGSRARSQTLYHFPVSSPSRWKTIPVIKGQPGKIAPNCVRTKPRNKHPKLSLFNITILLFTLFWAHVCGLHLCKHASRVYDHEVKCISEISMKNLH